MRTDPQSIQQIENELRAWDGPGITPSDEAIGNLVSVLGCLNEPDIDVDPEDGAIYARWTCKDRINMFTLCFVGPQIVSNLSVVRPTN